MERFQRKYGSKRGSKKPRSSSKRGPYGWRIPPPWPI
jgi:hypothetical protein